jgi:predicted dehydrogenase
MSVDGPSARERLGVAVVGAGHWGGNYVRVLGQLPDARPAVVCDREASRLAAVARQFPDVALTTALGDVLERRDVDAVVVATPATTHADVATACLAAGKHVLVEKPLTTSLARADELIRFAEERGLVLMVGHTFLFNPSVLKVRELVMRPALGKLHYVYARRTNLGPIRDDVNALWDLAAHDVSIFAFILEAVPEWVSAVGARVLGRRHEDVGFVSLGYPNGVIGHIHVSWADPNKVREVVVVAANQRIVLNDMDPQESVRVYERGVSLAPTAPLGAGYGEYPLMLRDGDIVSPRVEPSEPLRNQTAHFVECVRRGWTPATSGRAGRDVVLVMEAVDRSLAGNGAPTEVGPPVAVSPNGGLVARALR